jgi:Mrp family chromosome partitioning ATPase
VDQVPRLSPVPAAVPVGKHASAFMHLYYALEARRTSMIPLVIQFISPSPKAGVSVASSGYARVAAEAQAGRVLFAEASCRDPNPADRAANEATLVDAFQSNGSPATAIFPARFAKNLFWTRLSEGRGSSLNLGVERLQLLFDSLRRDHSLIILDCGSRMGPEATALARYCDGSVLVVAAGKTSQSEISAARRQIERVGGQVVGLVLNRERGRTSRRGEEFC